MAGQHLIGIEGIGHGAVLPTARVSEGSTSDGWQAVEAKASAFAGTVRQTTVVLGLGVGAHGDLLYRDPFFGQLLGLGPLQDLAEIEARVGLDIARQCRTCDLHLGRFFLGEFQRPGLYAGDQ